LGTLDQAEAKQEHTGDTVLAILWEWVSAQQEANHNMSQKTTSPSTPRPPTTVC
jgi:hypothetical protein